MKNYVILILFSLCLALASCQKAMNSEEIYNKTSSGVVLILNYFYYSVTLPNGEEIYFTGIDDEGELDGLTYEKEEAVENCNGCTGTGFFISENGTLLTNRHVVEPEVSEDVVKSFLKDYKHLMKEYCQEKMQGLQQTFYNYQGNIAAQESIAGQYKGYAELLEEIDDMDMNDAEFNTHSKIGIAYNDTHVVKVEDFKSCSVLAVSEDSDVDLALIQLDDEETPEGRYIFKLREDDAPLTLDEKLFMIGYNLGFSIAKTAKGIRAQVYSGSVTQKDDGVKILYSIPSHHGSSGSPVVNEQGELVAVNFAGFEGTQGFNYGIPSKKVREFLQDN